MANVAKKSIQRVFVLGLLILIVLVGILVFKRGEEQGNQNIQMLSLTNTALVAEVNTRATELAILEKQKEQVEKQTRISLAHQLAAQAQSLAPQDSEQMTALLLAIESMHLYPTVDAGQLLSNNKLAISVSHVMHGNYINFVGFSPDSKYLISMGEHDNTVRVSEVETGKEVARVVHNYGAWSVAVSADGKYVVSGGGDSTARVWEIDTGKQISTMSHGGVVWTVAFSPDGKYVVSSSDDKITRIWEARTGEEIARLSREDAAPSVVFSRDGKYVFDNATSIVGDLTQAGFIRVTHDIYISAISPDGRYIVSKTCEKVNPSTACDEGSIRVWEAMMGREIAHMRLNGGVTSLAFSPNGKYIVSAAYHLESSTYESAVQVWETETGKEISRMTHNGFESYAAFTPDGNYVVSSEETMIRVWELFSGKEIARMTHGLGVSSLAVSPNGKYVAAGGGGFVAHVWNIEDRMDAATRKSYDSPVTASAFSSDRKYVASGSDDGVAHVWEVDSGKEVAQVTVDGGLTSVALSPHGEYLAASSYDKTIRVWEVRTGQQVARMTHDSYIRSLVFSPNGKELASVSDDHTVRVWQAQTGQEISRLTYDQGANVAAFSPDGKWVVSGGCDQMGYGGDCLQGSARVWDALTGRELARVSHDYYAQSVAFSPDGKYVVSGGDQTARLWEVGTGQELAHMTHTSGVTTVVFSPDGKYVLSSDSHDASLWEAKTAHEVVRLNNENFWHGFAFSPDSKYIASADDQYVYVWDVETGREITRITQEIAVYAVAFSQDGRHIISQSLDHTVHEWLYRPEDLIADACSRLTRNLTDAEWNQFIGAALPREAVCPNLPLEPEPITSSIILPTPIATQTLNP